VGLSILQAMNKFKFRAVATSIMAILNIVFSIFLAKVWGATGAALGTTISLIICNIVVMNIYYKRKIGLDIGKFWKNILEMFLKLLVPFAIVAILIVVTNLQGWLAIVVYGGLYVVLYLMSAYLFVANEYEKKYLKRVLKKLHIKV
jgi:O-antigen/teichoic acid export membrane protein